MSDIYPSLLRPTAVEMISSAGQTISVPKVVLQFRRWQGTLPADALGNKPFVDFGGRPVFAELCAYELFRLSGWDARWVETYGAPAMKPKLLTDWQDVPRRQQVSRQLSNSIVSGILENIAKLNGNIYAGCWDVVGWHREIVVFAELKRRKQDQMQKTQLKWLTAALQAGLESENFLLIEWDFLEEA